MNQPNRVLCYARVSTDQQDSSSRQQIQRLEEFCQRKGFNQKIICIFATLNRLQNEI